MSTRDLLQDRGCSRYDDEDQKYRVDRNECSWWSHDGMQGQDRRRSGSSHRSSSVNQPSPRHENFADRQFGRQRDFHQEGIGERRHGSSTRGSSRHRNPSVKRPSQSSRGSADREFQDHVDRDRHCGPSTRRRSSSMDRPSQSCGNFDRQSGWQRDSLQDVVGHDRHYGSPSRHSSRHRDLVQEQSNYRHGRSPERDYLQNKDSFVDTGRYNMNFSAGREASQHRHSVKEQGSFRYHGASGRDSSEHRGSIEERARALAADPRVDSTDFHYQEHFHFEDALEDNRNVEKLGGSLTDQDMYRRPRTRNDRDMGHRSRQVNEGARKSSYKEDVEREPLHRNHDERSQARQNGTENLDRFERLRSEKVDSRVFIEGREYNIDNYRGEAGEMSLHHSNSRRIRELSSEFRDDELYEQNKRSLRMSFGNGHNITFPLPPSADHERFLYSDSVDNFDSKTKRYKRFVSECNFDIHAASLQGLQEVGPFAGHTELGIGQLQDSHLDLLKLNKHNLGTHQVSQPLLPFVSQEAVSRAICDALGASIQIQELELIQAAFTTADAKPNSSGKATKARLSQVASDSRPPPSTCPLMSCRSAVVDLRDHILQSHLPPCFSEMQNTSTGTLRQRNIVLHALAQEFTDSEGVPGLLEMVQSSKLMSGAGDIEAGLIPSLQAFSEFVGEPIPEHYTLDPPNACAVLTHWRVLLQLLCIGGKEVQERFGIQFQIQKPQTSGQTGAASPVGMTAVGLTFGSNEAIATHVSEPPLDLSTVQNSSGDPSCNHAKSDLVQPRRRRSQTRNMDQKQETQSMQEAAVCDRRRDREVAKRKRSPSPKSAPIVEYGHMSQDHSAGHALSEDLQSGLRRPQDKNENKYHSLSWHDSSDLSRHFGHGSSQDHTEVGKITHFQVHDEPVKEKGAKQRVEVKQSWTENQNVSEVSDMHQGTGLEQTTFGIIREGSLSSITGTPVAVDCHFYLDVLVLGLFGKKRLKQSRVGLDTLQNKCSRPDSNHVQLAGAVGSFSNPENYSFIEDGSWYTEDGCLGFCVGFNPKYSNSLDDGVLDQIRHLIKLPNMRAFGDVGLSYFACGKDIWELQRSNLRKLLRILPSSLPVKLSCRKSSPSMSRKKGSRDVYQDLLDIARSELPPNQPIYHVSFNGDVNVVKTWLARFPNCYFGISPKCVMAGVGVKNAISQIPEDRLLLESSAPAFPLPGHSQNSPLYLGLLAMYVAKFRGLEDARQVLSITTQNARRLFRLP